MKFVLRHGSCLIQCVTLHVRVWIEIVDAQTLAIIRSVTLHVRVWIEISCFSSVANRIRVTLHVRVWIEMFVPRLSHYGTWSHPPREGVD